MSLPTYSEYKDSLVDGLGSVPAHWQMMRLGNLCSLIQTGPFGSQLHSEDYIDDGVPVINPSSIQSGTIVPDWSCTVSCDIAEELAQHKFQVGDIVFGRRGEMGRCALIRPENIGWLCGTGSLIVRLSSVNPEFGAVYLATSFIKQWLSLQSVGSTMDNLNASILAAVPVPVPPEHEQAAITAFLDHETRKIDVLIAKQERLLTLLAEKRRATISHAVTRGINTGAPMKDSGIAWLGKVPAHWCLSAIKRLGRIRYGIGEPPGYKDDGIPLIRATNVHAGKIFREGLVFVDPTDIPSQRIVWLAAGDIIVVRSGAYTGDSGLIDSDFDGSIAGFDMVLRLHSCAHRFAMYALLSSYLKDCQIDVKRMRAAQPHLNAEELGECVMAVPPADEQLTIVEYLDLEIAKLDALKGEAERAIGLLKERRSAVISAAVTGKIDVRDAVPKELAA